MNLHPAVAAVTRRIAERSQPTRSAYLAQVDAYARRTPGARAPWPACGSTG